VFLKSLSLKGFKSFADAAMLEFEPGITVVVGPNGSGKSNVVDAVAWVLGAQGPRTVRSSKMEDVIFVGTASRPALGRAEVTLTIDNSAGKLATDLAEITITRTLFRSGDSEYAINGTSCRLLDVQELLSDTGVGRQQHVIISQGQLDAILNARPEDRRGVIEEAAGVLKFRRRRERSERRLASTDENLERLFDLVREVKRQIRPLERQAAAARSHTEMVDELRAVRMHEAGLELAALDRRRTDGTRTRGELREAEEQLQVSLSDVDAATSRTTDELSAQREADLASSLGRVEGLVERGRGITGVLRERQRSLAQALDAAADADVVSTLEAEGARLGHELEAAEAESETLALEQDELAAVDDALAVELQTHLDQRGDGSALREAEEEVTVARGQLGSTERGLDRDRRTLEQITSRLAGFERRAATLGREEEELTERLTETEQARQRLQVIVAETERAHTAAAQRLETAEESLRQAEQEHHRSAARADALAKALDEARGAAGAELLSGVSGVVGTLLDLVEVDSGWEDAFEAAAGASLAAVVVSGSDAARAALSRLRQGEATGAVLALNTAVGGSSPTSGVPGSAGSAAGAPAVRVPAAGASGATVPGAAVPGAAAGAATVPGEPVRAHVRGRRGRDVTGLDRLLDTLLANAVCPLGGWTGAIDLALDRPDLVVVTREGDRFSASGWRVRAGGGVVTAAVVDGARERAERAEGEAGRASEERRLARVAVEETRAAAAEAVRSDDRNEGAHLSARNALGRVTNERSGMTAEIEETSRQYTELDERIERDAARVADLQAEIPILDAARVAAADQAEAARAERVRIDERIAAAAAARKAFEVRAAGLVERRRVLSERLMEVERRLTGHADERQQAAERRRRLEADAVAVERLLGVVGGAQLQLDRALGELRDRHRLQIEAVRAGGERLEALRRERSAAEHELAAHRSRLQKIELELAEASIRRDAVVESLHRELNCDPDEALASPEPELPEGVDPATRVVQLEGELAKLGPVNPLALEELSALGERHQFLEAQVEDVRKARRELQQIIRTLDEEIMVVFDSAFSDVREHFSDLVDTLFPGGTGRLSLTDPENLLETGVEVEVRPAGRNVRKLSLLSGGERSLVALAFLFAVFKSRPSPFYLMDEVEAALDDVNLHRFLGLVHEFREDAQLIIVSHQKRTMEAGDALYGVTMAPGGSSKVVSQKVPRRADDPGSLSLPEDDSTPAAPNIAAPSNGAAALEGASTPRPKDIATSGTDEDTDSSPFDDATVSTASNEDTAAIASNEETASPESEFYPSRELGITPSPEQAATAAEQVATAPEQASPESAAAPSPSEEPLSSLEHDTPPGHDGRVDSPEQVAKADSPGQDGRSDEGPNPEGPNNEDPRHEGPSHETPNNEGPSHEGPSHEGPSHEGPSHEGPSHEGPSHEDSGVPRVLRANDQ
jgi:chromosome segregation protein